ncbi:Protein of unknown function [Gryllus bimaculatus]|nr:Protein of unknown function [Gryllus bimaculatus]
MDQTTTKYSGTQDEDFIVTENTENTQLSPSDEEVVPREEHFSDDEFQEEAISEERTYRNILSITPDASPDYSPVQRATNTTQRPCGLRRSQSAPNLSTPEAV